jgi:hypothetical protein
MATKTWTPNGALKAQTITLLVGSSTVGDSFVTTCNGKSYTYVAITGDTTSTIATAIGALLSGSQDGEFQAITWSVDTATVTGTAGTTGEPFTVSKSGTGTYTLTTTQANSSPQDAADTSNWSGASLPINADDVVFELTSTGVRWNLESAISGVSLTSLKVRDSFQAGISNPNYTVSGTPYHEYRGTTFTVTGCTTLEVWQPSGAQAGDFRFNVGAVAETLRIYGDGSGSIGSEVVVWRGTNAANVAYVVGGSLAVAVEAGQSATLLTLNIQGGQVRCGTGVTLTTVNLDGGAFDTRSAVTTLTALGGATATVRDAATLTTANVDGASTLDYRSSGTLTTILAAPNTTLDFSGGRDAVTVTNCTINEGCTINDPDRRVTWTNPIVLNRTSPTKVNLNVGTHVKVAITAGP